MRAIRGAERRMVARIKGLSGMVIKSKSTDHQNIMNSQEKR
jgi:hypothetical protein